VRVRRRTTIQRPIGVGGKSLDDIYRTKELGR